MRASWSKETNSIEIVTENLRFLAVSKAALSIVLDGTSFGIEGAPRLGPPQVFRRETEGWRRLEALFPPEEEKSARCSGPFKRAFDHHFVLVVGSQGEPAEDRELLARARYDSLQWWYRANGQASLLSDEAYLMGSYGGRNVILYGNRDTNSAWNRVLDADCPIQAERGRIRVGARVFEGADLGAVFLHPKLGEPTRLVGVFADSGRVGTRLGLILAPFVSGVGYPDWAVFDSRVLREGDGGVLDAGWFTHEWRLGPDPGETAR